MLLGCMMTVLGMTGCATTRTAETVDAMRSTMPTPRVTLEPGDEIEIKFFYNPELNETQRIRPDGKITLQLVGDVVAGGKTPEELTYMLTKLSELILENPAVTVFLRDQPNRLVYVGGEVERPTALPLNGNMTALSAIMLAGGFNAETANEESVVVIRHEAGRRYGCTLDLAPSLYGQEDKPFYLASGDIIYVPRTPIVKLGQWIDQHINSIVPRLGVTYTEGVGSDGRIGIDTTNN